MRKVLLYDGTYQGFLSACLAVLEREEGVVEIRMGKEAQLALSGFLWCEASPEDAARMQDRIVRRMGKKAGSWVELTFRSELPGREEALLDFLRLGFREGKGWERHPRSPEVERVERMARFTWREYHRWKGITRFRYREEAGFFVAEIEPSADILDLLARHFWRRMSGLSWAIRDVKRGKEVVCRADPRFPAGDITDAGFPDRDQTWALWREYYFSICLPERSNPRLKKAHLPARYWKYVPECVDGGPEGREPGESHQPWMDPPRGLSVETHHRQGYRRWAVGGMMYQNDVEPPVGPQAQQVSGGQLQFDAASLAEAVVNRLHLQLSSGG